MYRTMVIMTAYEPTFPRQVLLNNIINTDDVVTALYRASRKTHQL